MMSDYQTIVSLKGLLREFIECDAIANYDSKLCWGCGVYKDGEDTHDAECLIQRAKAAIG